MMNLTLKAVKATVKDWMLTIWKLRVLFLKWVIYRIHFQVF